LGLRQIKRARGKPSIGPPREADFLLLKVLDENALDATPFDINE
jgi:hypothetical protein